MTDLNTIFFGLIAVAVTSCFLLFLPAILELKLPKDAGPRLINAQLAKHISNGEIANNSLLRVRDSPSTLEP